METYYLFRLGNLSHSALLNFQWRIKSLTYFSTGARLKNDKYNNQAIVRLLYHYNNNNQPSFVVSLITIKSSLLILKYFHCLFALIIKYAISRF